MLNKNLLNKFIYTVFEKSKQYRLENKHYEIRYPSTWFFPERIGQSDYENRS